MDSNLPDNPDEWNTYFQAAGLPAIPLPKPAPKITSINGPSSLPYDTMPDHQKCANCAKGGCTLTCSRCKVTGVGHIQAYYCSSECQKADWKCHRPVCRSRQQIAHAVSILVELWGTLQSKTYTKRGDFALESNGFIAFESWKLDEDRRCYTGASVFRRFPDDVVPVNMTARAERAILFDPHGNEITSVGMPWVERFLKPFCTKIEEIDFHIKNPALMIESLTHTRHNALRVTTKMGEVFAIDISGANYRIHTITLECALGNAMKAEALELSMSQPISFSAVNNIRRGLACRIDESYDFTTRRFPGGINGLMLQTRTEFDDFKRVVVNSAKSFMDEALAALYRSNIGRMFLINQFSKEHFFSAVTPDSTYGTLLEKVWFTETEMAKFSDDKSLKKAWTRRMDKIMKGNPWC